MKIIADSGSTKTHWVILSQEDESLEYFTQGINPYVQKKEYIQKVILEELLPLIPEPKRLSSGSLYYYGAGVSSESQAQVVSGPLRDCFPNFNLHIEHDLLGAARALCGREPGIAGILGTGANSCYFDGLEILENIPALGYVLGDEGSGSYLGRNLLKQFFYKNLPEDLSEEISGGLGLTKEMVLNKVYQEPNPNRYLASFSPFIFEHRNHPYMNTLIVQSFKDFFRTQVSKYSRYHEIPFHCVGSVGFIFKEELGQAASSLGIKTGSILKTPMEGLIRFHAG